MSKFERLKERLARRPDIYDPAGLAATIGRKKLGAEEFEAKVEAGREDERKED